MFGCPYCCFLSSSPPSVTVPQAPPADVTCASQQHSITVSWNPPNPDTINGILTEYHVSYFAANEYGGELSLLVFFHAVHAEL